MPSIAVLAGGLATRLHPMSEVIAKSMVEVAGAPFIAHQLRLFEQKGISNVVVCVGHLGGQIEEYLKDGKDFGLNVTYSYDGDKLLGTGGALRKALPLLGDLFWITYGDSYLDTEYRDILNYFVARDKHGLMTVFKNCGRWDRSNVLFEGGQVLVYDKNACTAVMEHIDYGLALLRKEAVYRIPLGKVFDLADLYSELVSQGEMLGFEVKERFYEIGSFAGLKETGEYILGKWNKE